MEEANAEKKRAMGGLTKANYEAAVGRAGGGRTPRKSRSGKGLGSARGSVVDMELERSASVAFVTLGGRAEGNTAVATIVTPDSGRGGGGIGESARSANTSTGSLAPPDKHRRRRRRDRSNSLSRRSDADLARTTGSGVGLSSGRRGSWSDSSALSSSSSDVSLDSGSAVAVYRTSDRQRGSMNNLNLTGSPSRSGIVEIGFGAPLSKSASARSPRMLSGRSAGSTRSEQRSARTGYAVTGAATAGRLSYVEQETERQRRYRRGRAADSANAGDGRLLTRSVSRSRSPHGALSDDGSSVGRRTPRTRSPNASAADLVTTAAAATVRVADLTGDSGAVACSDRFANPLSLTLSRGDSGASPVRYGRRDRSPSVSPRLQGRLTPRARTGRDDMLGSSYRSRSRTPEPRPTSYAGPGRASGSGGGGGSGDGDLRVVGGLSSASNTATWPPVPVETVSVGVQCPDGDAHLLSPLVKLYDDRLNTAARGPPYGDSTDGTSPQPTLDALKRVGSPGGRLSASMPAMPARSTSGGPATFQGREGVCV